VHREVAVGAGGGLDGIDKTKLEHIHMKMHDTQNMCDGMHGRIEEIWEILKQLSDDNGNRTQFDLAISKKISVYEDNFEFLKNLINNLEKRLKSFEGIDVSGLKTQLANVQGLATGQTTETKPAEATDVDFGRGMGGGMDDENYQKLNLKITTLFQTLDKDRELQKKNEAHIEKVKRKVNDIDDVMKNGKIQSTGMSQTLAN
jgi:uncharacterized coiled-coil DUF342 family protein